MTLQDLNKSRGVAIFCALLSCCLTLFTGYTDGFDSVVFRISFGFTIVGTITLLRGMYLHRQAEKLREKNSLW